MFERFGLGTRRILAHANHVAGSHAAAEIRPEHLLAGLIRDASPEIDEIFRRFVVSFRELQTELMFDLVPPELPDDEGLAEDDEDDFAGFQEELQRELEREAEGPVALPLGDSARDVLQLAVEEAMQLGSRTAESEHVLLGLLRQDGTLARRRLRGKGLELVPVRKLIVALASGAESFTRPPDALEALKPGGVAGELCDQAMELPALDRRRLASWLLASLDEPWLAVEDLEEAWRVRSRRDFPGLDPDERVVDYWTLFFGRVLDRRRQPGS